MVKLQKKHIQEEWSDEDGYWIALKSGFKSSSDPVGALHTIHEDTKREAWAEGVELCSCSDCKPSKRKQKAAAALAAQATAVESAAFVQSPVSDLTRAAYAYDRAASARGWALPSRFKVGDVCRIDHQRRVCFRVTECCACFALLSNRSEVYRDGDVERISISAEYAIEQRLGEDWRSKLFGQQPEQPKEPMNKETSEAEKAASSESKSAKSAFKPKPKSGKKSDLNPIGAEVLASGHISLSGRSEFIHKLMDKGERDLEIIMKKVREKWPTHCSRAHIGKTVKAYAQKLEKK